MSRKGKSLTVDDRILWGQVAKTVDAYPGRMEALLDSQPQAGPAPEKKSAGPAGPLAPKRPMAAPSKKPGLAPRALNPIDKPVYKKLAKGRVPLEARIDLHGLTQSEAHDLLLGFLIRAHARGLRHVLVITGKGQSRGGDGVLRRSVPRWLGAAEFHGLASGCEPAARGHGGDGALYVRLKKREHGP
ncbi:Smr/MutS family protein [Hoeflea sp. TYP-13]|uniref:Smr/MutS family protein n=1 Tax=Hoeflea sp. TYP-13 TaxID=3230023 RepID=UPI0034C5D837